MDSPVQQLVPPVVIISACGLLCLGQFARYTAITGRLRGFHRERLEGLAKLLSLTGEEHRLFAERCDELERQAHRLLGLVKLIRNALLLLVLAVMCMIVSSLMIGVEAFAPRVGWWGAVVAFVAGLLCMLSGMAFVFAEVRRSLTLVKQEHFWLEQINETDAAVMVGDEA